MIMRKTQTEDMSQICSKFYNALEKNIKLDRTLPKDEV
jgi:hypothetical protein